MNFPLPTTTLAIMLSALLSGNGFTQEIDHAKFLAQQAALSALEGPGAFTLRESWLKGTITPDAAKLVAQQLYKKNSYQFWLATPDPGVEVFLNIYDGKGKLMSTETVRYPQKTNIISLIVTPAKTGIYHLRLAITKTDKAQEWALIYAYK